MSLEIRTFWDISNTSCLSTSVPAPDKMYTVWADENCTVRADLQDHGGWLTYRDAISLVRDRLDLFTPQGGGPADIEFRVSLASKEEP